MHIYQGKSVLEGVAIGPLRLMHSQKPTITDAKGEGAEKEEAKFRAAQQKAVSILQKLYESALSSVGKSDAEIFAMHIDMTEDLDLEDAVIDRIKQGANAAYAVKEAGNEIAKTFAQMEDEYMQARSVDVLDVCNRLCNCILGIEEESVRLSTPCILAASDLTPAQIMQLDKSLVLGFVTARGSNNSHTAILARTLSLPSVVNTQTEIPEKFDGCLCVIDGFTGKVYINPDEATLQQYKQKQTELLAEREMLASLKNAESVTKDGKKTAILANVGRSLECDVAIESGAEGVGLFRSEFLYLESTDYPTEEAQFAEYSAAVQKMQGRPIVIRTMDIGADKQAKYFQLPPEENPALGYRSVRICFDRPQILKTQLRAIYRASAFGNLSVMIPMITSLQEVRFVKALAEEVKKELSQEGVAFRADMPIGIMIETPAAALIADELAKEVDFFSVGTNDLTQYTLAIDRQNQALEKFYDPRHKALLRLIRFAADAIHAQGKWIGICGELARDLTLTEFFLKIGIDELSVSAPYILPLRKRVQSIDTRSVLLETWL